MWSIVRCEVVSGRLAVRLRCCRGQRDERTVSQQIIHVRCQLNLSKAEFRFAFVGELLTTLPIEVVKDQLGEVRKDRFKKPDNFEVD